MYGNLDFSIPLDCGASCYVAYYLYNNPKTEKFQHNKQWDYLRIQKINKTKKQIFTFPDGNARSGEQILYQVEDEKLIKSKTIKF